MIPLFVAIRALVKSVISSLRDPKYRGLFLFLGAIVLGGTIFYRKVEGWSFVDSFYFCIVTLATVGYGDLAPTTPLGKIFTAVYIILGLAVFVAFVNAIGREIMEQRSRRHPEEREDEGPIFP